MCKNPEEKDEPLFLYDMYLKSNGKISFISLWPWERWSPEKCDDFVDGNSYTRKKGYLNCMWVKRNKSFEITNEKSMLEANDTSNIHSKNMSNYWVVYSTY